ncbi:MAG: hypothetical protein ACYC6A_15240 [Armatimonadota bacterium]
MDALRTRELQGREQDRFPSFRLWGRLLWKEWREGWPILAIGVILPLLTLPLSKREGWERSGFDYSVMGLVGILLVLWAADRTRRIGMDRGAVRQALPVSPSTRWVFTYLVPLPVPMLAGMSLGVMIHAWHDWMPNALWMLTGILFLTSAFLVTTLLTAALSFIPAAILGVLWLFSGLDTEQPDSIFPMYVKVGIACLLAALAWDAFAAKQRYWAGRTVMVVLLLIALINPEELRGIGWPSRTNAVSKPQPHIPWTISYRKLPEWTHVVTVMRDTSKNAHTPHATVDSVELRYFDRRTRETRLTRSFTQVAQPLAFISEHEVLIGRQSAGEPDIQLSAWDLQTDSVSEKGRLAAEKNLLSSSVGADLSPDGRYLAIYKLRKSDKIDSDPTNDPVDLWIADLSRGRAVPVMMNVFPNDYSMQSPASWAPDGLYLSALGGSIRVDLKTLRGRYLTPADFRRKP